MLTKEDLIRGLNEDLETELSTIINLLNQEDELEELMSSELRDLFTREIEDELGYTASLNDTIVDLGGEPSTTPNTSNKLTDLEEVLLLDLKMEWKGVGDFMKHAKLAEELGEGEFIQNNFSIRNSIIIITHELRRMLRRLQRESTKDLG